MSIQINLISSRYLHINLFTLLPNEMFVIMKLNILNVEHVLLTADVIVSIFNNNKLIFLSIYYLHCHLHLK